MLKKKFQVFISSTYEDLKEERAEVTTGILKAGHIPIGMERFAAIGEQKKIIGQAIDESDIFVLMIGIRYGALEKSGISYTEWEFNTAKAKRKPIIVLVLDENYCLEKIKGITSLDSNIDETTLPNYKKFKKEVEESQIVSMVSSLKEISGLIFPAIDKAEELYGDDLVGWIPGNYLQQVNQYERLTHENDTNKRKILDLKREVKNEKEFTQLSTRIDDNFRDIMKKSKLPVLSKKAIEYINDQLEQEVQVLTEMDDYEGTPKISSVMNPSEHDRTVFSFGEDSLVFEVVKGGSQKIKVTSYVWANNGHPQIAELDILELKEGVYINNVGIELSHNLIEEYLNKFQEEISKKI